MLTFNPNKRKSFGNKNESAQSAKKVKQEKSTNISAPQIHGQKQKQNKNKGNKQQQKPSKWEEKAVKQETETEQKPLKLNMFPGTAVLKVDKGNVKKELGSLKNQKEKVKIEKLEEGIATDTEPNRHKRKRAQRKHRRIETRQKEKDLKMRALSGDIAAVREVEEKIKELDKIEDKSKTCQRKLKVLKDLLQKKPSKVEEGNIKPNQSQQRPTIGNKKALAKASSFAQNQQKGKQKQVEKEKPKVESDESGDSEESLIEERSDDMEEASDEENASEEDSEVEVSDNDEEESDEKSPLLGDLNQSLNEDDSGEESDEEEGEEDEQSEESDAESKEDDEGSDDDEESDDDNEVEEDKVAFVKNLQNKQIVNKKKQNQQISNTKDPAPNLNELVGKGGKARYVVFVGNLPFSITKEELTEHFKKKCEIVDVRIQNGKGFGYVELANEDSYQKALSFHLTFIGGRRINVLYTKGGKKNSSKTKAEITAKNLKLSAMRKQGQLSGSVKADQKRSVRRAKKRYFEK